MTKLLCTLFLILTGLSAYSHNFYNTDILGEPFPLNFPAEEIKENSALNETDSPAYFKRFVCKIKNIPGPAFSLSPEGHWPILDFSGEIPKVVPNLNISKIIYPFHSFL